MSTRGPALLSFTLGLAMACFALMLVSDPASSQVAAPSVVKWEYNSVTVEANSLQAKLGELANDHWDVFSVTSNETKLDNADPMQPRLIVLKYEVTARRPAGR